MPLKSLKLPPEGTLLGGPEAVPMRPDFPWGTRIELNEDALKLLNIGEMPEVGSVLGMKARVMVVAEREEVVEGKGKVRNLALQITEMDLTGNFPEDKSQATVIYTEDN